MVIFSGGGCPVGFASVETCVREFDSVSQFRVVAFLSVIALSTT